MSPTASRPRRIGVAGMGYVGTATALAFAERGHRVLGYDIDEERLRALRAQHLPLHEAGLPELLRRHSRNHRLELTDALDQMVEQCETVFLCLPTPSLRNGDIDLSFLEAAAGQIGAALARSNRWHLLVVKSTVVPGTTEGVVGRIVGETGHRTPGEDFSVASNPEFLAEGTLVQDALRPSRIVIGVSDRRSEAALRAIYAPFRAPFEVLPPAGAELVKYASNAMLALRVSFANEISRMAERAGVDYEPVIRAVGKDPRIGDRFLVAGPGFGGSCFEKDLRALINWAHEQGLPARLPESALAANDDQVLHVVDLIESTPLTLNGRTVALLGLSFKEGTADTRGSRAYPLLTELLRKGAKVRLYDPEAMESFRRGLPSGASRWLEDRIHFAPTLEDCVTGADLALIHTDWEAFRKAPVGLWKSLRDRLVVDTRRTLDPSRLEKAGVRYRRVGAGVPPTPV